MHNQLPRIHCPSNSSLDYYPDNTASEYSVKIPNFESIAQNRTVSVGLSNIIFPNAFKNVREGLNKVEIFEQQDIEIGHDPANWILRETIVIPANFYPAINKLVTAIKNLQSNVTQKAVKVSHNKLTRKSAVLFNTIGWGIRFGGDLARLLGFYSNSIIYPKSNAKLKNEGSFHSTIDGGLTTLYIYSNIVKESIVGGRWVALVRILNWDHRSKLDNISLEFDRIEYIPLKHNNFDTIELSICDDFGNPVQFMYGKVIITLDFKFTT